MECSGEWTFEGILKGCWPKVYMQSLDAQVKHMTYSRTQARIRVPDDESAIVQVQHICWYMEKRGQDSDQAARMAACEAS